MKKYTDPVLSTSDPKDWFVYYRILDDTGKRRLVKVRGNLNRIKNLREKKSEAKDLLIAVADELKRGYSPYEKGDEWKTKPLVELFPQIIELKKTLRRRTWQSYKYCLDTLTKYLEAKKRSHLLATEFTELDAIGFCDYVQTVLKWKPATFNGNRGNISICFNILKDRKIISENPWNKTKRMVQEIGKNIAFSDKQRDKLKAALIKKDPRLYIFVQFSYYCFIRPKEILGLKVENIDLEKWRIHIPSSISKNRKSEYVEIPHAFRPTIKEMGLEKYPANYFIFSRSPGMATGPEPRGRNSVSMKHTGILDPLKFGDQYTMYSWKHTGVVAAFNAGVDIYSIMRQCRHHDLSETSKYLKSLGLIENTEFSRKQTAF